MIANTSAECVNYRLDTHDLGVAKKHLTPSVVRFKSVGFFLFSIFSTVHRQQLILLLVAAMATAREATHSLASERSSIESTYELTKYLEYQLKEIKDIYVSPLSHYY